MTTTKNSQSENSDPRPRGSAWVNLAALVAILAFALISTVIGHQSVEAVSGESTITMALLALWRGGGGEGC
jgi:hypothetical protein